MLKRLAVLPDAAEAHGARLRRDVHDYSVATGVAAQLERQRYQARSVFEVGAWAQALAPVASYGLVSTKAKLST